MLYALFVWSSDCEWVRVLRTTDLRVLLEAQSTWEYHGHKTEYLGW